MKNQFLLAKVLGRRSIVAAVAAVIALALTTPARASVVWTVEQVGNDVVATASGDFTLRNTSTEQFFGTDNYVSRDFVLYSFTYDNSSYWKTNFVAQGVADQVPFLLDADNGTGKFGSVGAKVFLDLADQTGLDGNTNVSWYAVSASLTWAGKTVDDVLGVNFAPGTSRVIWNEYSSLGDQTISVARVPEPGTLALAGLAFVGLAATRRRKPAA